MSHSFNRFLGAVTGVGPGLAQMEESLLRQAKMRGDIWQDPASRTAMFTDPRMSTLMGVKAPQVAPGMLTPENYRTLQPSLSPGDEALLPYITRVPAGLPPDVNTPEKAGMLRDLAAAQGQQLENKMLAGGPGALPSGFVPLTMRVGNTTYGYPPAAVQVPQQLGDQPAAGGGLGGPAAGGAGAGGGGRRLGGTRATRNNNPGNIKASQFTRSFPGVVGIDPNPAADGGHFLIFDSPQSGFGGMQRLLRGKYRGLGGDPAMRRWSGGGYGARDMAIDPNRPIGEYTDQELNELTQRMARREGYGGTREGAPGANRMLAGGETPQTRGRAAPPAATPPAAGAPPPAAGAPPAQPSAQPAPTMLAADEANKPASSLFAPTEAQAAQPPPGAKPAVPVATPPPAVPGATPAPAVPAQAPPLPAPAKGKAAPAPAARPPAAPPPRAAAPAAPAPAPGAAPAPGQLDEQDASDMELLAPGSSGQKIGFASLTPAGGDLTAGVAPATPAPAAPAPAGAPPPAGGAPPAAAPAAEQPGGARGAAVGTQPKTTEVPTAWRDRLKIALGNDPDLLRRVQESGISIADAANEPEIQARVDKVMRDIENKQKADQAAAAQKAKGASGMQRQLGSVDAAIRGLVHSVTPYDPKNPNSTALDVPVSKEWAQGSRFLEKTIGGIPVVGPAVTEALGVEGGGFPYAPQEWNTVNQMAEDKTHPWHRQASELRAMRGMSGLVVRSFGDVGAMSDKEKQDAIDYMLPRAGEPPDARKQKVAVLLSMLQGVQAGIRNGSLQSKGQVRDFLRQQGMPLDPTEGVAQPAEEAPATEVPGPQSRVIQRRAGTRRMVA
jgi:hypothetical protein